MSNEPQRQKQNAELSSKSSGRSHSMIGVPKSQQKEEKGGSSSFLKTGLALALAGTFLFGGLQLMKAPERIPASTPITSVVAQKERVLTISKVDVNEKLTTEVRQKLDQGIIPEELKESSPEVIEKIKNKEMSMYTLRVIDTAVNDGDVVGVSVNNLAIGQIALTNEGAEIQVPLVNNQEQVLKINAVRDGGGGVTFGAQSSTGKAMTRVMNVGDVDTWRIVF